MLNYKDKSYAAGRLCGTIVRYENKPVLVCDIMSNEVSYKNLLTGEMALGDYDKLDINPVPLGYTNFKGVAYYLSRCPMRKDWKQGLREQTMRALMVGDSQPVIKSINMTELAKTIVGEFPTLEKVVHHMKSSGTLFSMAFSRTFALDNQLNLWHKSINKVGTINPKNLKTTINDEFFWVKEELEESIG